MRINVDACDTSHCDPQIVMKGDYYGLRMKFHECNGVANNWVTFWAKSLQDLRVFTIVMDEKVVSHLNGTQSEGVANA